MGKILVNTVGVDFMIWETNPLLRKKNNLINVISVHSIEVGDLLIGSFGPEGVSTWIVEGVLDVRPSSLLGRNYLHLKIKWVRKSPDFFRDMDLSESGRFFENFIKKAA